MRDEALSTEVFVDSYNASTYTVLGCVACTLGRVDVHAMMTRSIGYIR